LEHFLRCCVHLSPQNSQRNEIERSLKRVSEQKFSCNELSGDLMRSQPARRCIAEVPSSRLACHILRAAWFRAGRDSTLTFLC
jgi:hypothetical protein